MSKKFIIQAALLIGFITAVFCEGICAFAESRRGITEDVFRLHVIANSDSDEDQALKLRVRNAVLEASANIFGGAVSAADAKQLSEENLQLFEAAAAAEIAASGYDYPVRCEVGTVHFDRRVYGSAELPEGDYSALRVIIGEGDGRNWWCVMFPALCLPAVTNTDEVLSLAAENGAISAEELELMQDPENYEVKLYFAEVIKKLCEKLNKA